MKLRRRYEMVGEADPQVVEEITQHLVAAFEEFINESPGDVSFMDGFMAAHNLHKALVASLVAETGMVELWDMAAATFEEAAARERAKRDG